ncbi:hypothetical protein PF008_g23171 [Phytophthora fragariae]|uniref:Uncharacterized protein n=1 Tax=Phytophthora fragariae TaxID=53985 RepID=A0A6G0QRQ9_9STRA|nr:hypothetical protein PF008_g23171 [Phytophthora fragariae]
MVQRVFALTSTSANLHLGPLNAMKTYWFSPSPDKYEDVPLVVAAVDEVHLMSQLPNSTTSKEPGDLTLIP